MNTEQLSMLFSFLALLVSSASSLITVVLNDYFRFKERELYINELIAFYNKAGERR